MKAPTISVVTTLYPLEYFARRVGGERVTVVNLIEPGVEAHTFEPTPADIRKLDAADVVVYVGADFEPWMARALDSIGKGDGSVITLTGADDGTDPHLWLDPNKARLSVDALRDGLGLADPAGAETYQAKAQALDAELEELDAQLSNGLNGCGKDHFVASHAAFGHLAERYGLEQVSISGLSPEAEPGARDLATIVDTIRELGVEYIMVEPVISTGFAETVAREVGAEMLPLHPLESLTPDESERGEDYFTVMRSNLESLRLALECE
jgi:zinc transport system substrate-binding protein